MWAAVIIAAAVIPLATQPDVQSASAEAQAVTIYRNPGVVWAGQHPDANGVALITEERTVDLPAGRLRIVFSRVSDAIVPQSATLAGLPGPAVERNFDYDLLTPESLLARSVGTTVTVVRIDPRTGKETRERGLLRAVGQDAVVQVGDKLEAVHCDGLPEGLVFDRTPPGLAETATLSALVEAPQAGRYHLKLSYLAKGFGWMATYVAQLAPDRQSLRLTGYITLTNDDDLETLQAPVRVVAGRWNRVPDYDDWGTDKAAPRKCFAQPGDEVTAQGLQELVVTGSRLPDQAQLGDYKIYTLPDPTTIGAHQSKQVELLDLANAKFERYYSFAVSPDGWRDDDPREYAASLNLRLRNVGKEGLGVPLPSGLVSVEATSPGGSPVLLGEAGFKDTAVGGSIDLELGAVPEVHVSVRQEVDPSAVKSRKLSISSWAVDVWNGTSQTIDFHLYHYRSADEISISHESRRHVMEFGAPAWIMKLKPDEHRVVRYTTEEPVADDESSSDNAADDDTDD